MAIHTNTRQKSEQYGQKFFAGLLYRQNTVRPRYQHQPLVLTRHGANTPSAPKPPSPSGASVAVLTETPRHAHAGSGHASSPYHRMARRPTPPPPPAGGTTQFQNRRLHFAATSPFQPPRMLLPSWPKSSSITLTKGKRGGKSVVEMLLLLLQKDESYIWADLEGWSSRSARVITDQGGKIARYC